MAQYFTDFSGDTVGQAPSGTTLRYESTAASYLVEARADSTGGKVLNADADAATLAGISWDQIDSDPNRANIEVVIRFIAPAGVAGGRVQALLRGAATSGDRIVDGYAHGINNSIQEKVLTKYAPGPGLTKFGSAAFSAAAATWFMIRARANGTDHKVKVWQGAAADEPAGWDAEVADAYDSAVGVVGLLVFDANNFKVDYVGIGTGGDSAPTVPVQSGPSLTAPASISPGETISFTCSFAPTSVTASDGTSTLTLTNTTNTSGDNYTAVVPALPAVGQSLQYTTFGAVTMSATDGTDTAEDTTTLVTSQFPITILGATFDTGELSWLYNFNPDPEPIEQGDQGTPRTAGITLNSDGGYVADSDGSYDITVIDKTDGIAQTFSLLVGPSASAIGRITRRNLTRRAITRRSLTARP